MDAFRLQWTGLQVNRAEPLPLVAMECSIQYATDGSSGNGGMDRGRLLAAMDAELASALGAEPHAVPKMNYAAAGAGVAADGDGNECVLGGPGIRRGHRCGRATGADNNGAGFCVPGGG